MGSLPLCLILVSISSRRVNEFIMFRLALIPPLVAVAFGWQNSWDGRHYMYCRNGQHIRKLQSIHDNHREDRLWQADCGDVAGVKADQNCAWAGNVNGWDEMLTYNCPSGKVITGMDSVHNNGREDRLFKFRCCGLRRVVAKCGRNRFGSQCQPWKSNAPHKHSYHTRCDFADGRTQKDSKNFCRTAVWETKYDPWCFTNDAKKRWEYCGVKKCKCPSGWFGENCEKQCNCKFGNSKCVGTTGACQGGCAYGFSGPGCQTKISAIPRNCYMTNWINNWDARMTYNVPSGWVLSGFFSIHDNGREDRRWKAVICQMNI